MHYCFIVVNLLVLVTSTTVQLACYPHNKTLPQRLYGHQMTYFKPLNSIYIFGGLTRKYYEDGGYTHGPSDAIYKWNLSDPSSWFEKINTTTPSEHFYSYSNNVVNINNKAYFIGVIDNSSFAEGESGPFLAGHPDPRSDRIHIFDPSDDSFLDTDNLTRPAFYGDWSYNCLVSNETHIFFMGPSNYIQMYDIADNLWYSTNQSEVTWGTSCMMIENDIYVFGGGSNRYYKYQWPDEWIYMGNKSLATRRSAITYSNGSIFIVGGYIPWKKRSPGHTFDYVLADIDIFDMETESITSTYYMREYVTESWSTRHEIYASTSIVIGKQLYVFGGCTDDIAGASSIVQICDISDPTRQPTEHPLSTTGTGYDDQTTPVGSQKIDDHDKTTPVGSQKIVDHDKIDIWVIIVITSIVVLLMIGVVLLWLFKKKGKKAGYKKTSVTDGDTTEVA